VEGRKDEVAGFGHRQGDLNRVDVAHLADEEDIGSSRRADRRARSNEGLSRPTSRWLTADVLWL